MREAENGHSVKTVSSLSSRKTAVTAADLVRRLAALADPEGVAGMARFGIRPKTAVLGVSVWEIRRLGREVGRNHRLALQLWASKIHEARILASTIDDPQRVSEAQMERWVNDFDSWDICDQVCGNLFDKTPCASRKALEWSRREQEFVRRAGFALMAYLAVHDKTLPASAFDRFLAAIVRGASDERNFVKKAVNWALRQIGKRSRALNQKAVAAANRIRRLDSPSARWVAADALRELRSLAVRERLRRGAGASRVRPRRHGGS